MNEGMAFPQESQDTQPWMQWMQWDGEDPQPHQAHSWSSNSEIEQQIPNSTSTDLPKLLPVTPLSPYGGGDFQSYLAVPDSLPRLSTRKHLPPTPTNSSSSPETPYLSEPRLSGDTLVDHSMAIQSSRHSLKRKSTDQHTSSRGKSGLESKADKPTSKKRPHNIIEKRYRANLNEKIAELRQSVPSLRSVKVAEDVEENEDQSGSRQLNKASILTKAVEYIRHLELRNRKLDSENVALKERLLRLEKVIESDSTSAHRHVDAFTSANAVEQLDTEAETASSKEERSAKHPPQGLIPVPESMRKLRQNLPQEHYGARYDNPQEGQRGGRKWPVRFMIGSLAGLMVIDGLGQSQEGSDSKSKGLFGIPLEFMDGWWFLRSPRAFIAAFVQYCHAGGIIPLMKGFFALSLLAFLVFTYLFNSKPAEIEKCEKPSQLRKVPSLASPIEARRQAWLTSMQALKLPHHSFFPEWLAVNVEWLKYTVRLLFGFPAYYWITGRSGEDELARIKAWDIAIDAQLAGGDPEISRSRLVLSIFASGTLPQSPARVMLKALHARVILWRIGADGGLISRISNKVAIYLADLQWRKAQRLAADIKSEDGFGLPSHLAELLCLDCGDVMLDAVLERAYNLMYDRQTSQDTNIHHGLSNLMDVVVEDHAIRAPFDAVAAWWSTQKLHDALVLSLCEDDHSQMCFKANLDQALAIAPPLSTVYMRAIAVKAVFFEQGRAANARLISEALPSPPSDSSLASATRRLDAPIFIDSSMPLSASSEISILLTCAKIMLSLYTESEQPTLQSPHDILEDLTLTLDPARMTILNFAPLVFTLRTLNARALPLHNPSLINTLSTCAHDHAKASILPARAMSKILPLLHPFTQAEYTTVQDHEAEHEHDRSILASKSRRQSIASHDTGYASQMDSDLEAQDERR